MSERKDDDSPPDQAAPDATPEPSSDGDAADDSAALGAAGDHPSSDDDRDAGVPEQTSTDDDELDEDRALDLPPAGLSAKLAGLHEGPLAHRVAFAFAMSVAVGLVLPFLGRMGFFDPWESHYAEVARQMAQRDDFLYPFWKDGYFFSKPVLLFWLTAPLYALVGAGHVEGALPSSIELLGRLPIALVSLSCSAIIWWCVRRLWGTRAATFSVICLSTTPFWALISRQAITDMLYVGPMSAAILLLAVCFFDDDRERWRRAPIPWWLMALCGAFVLPQLWEVGRTATFLDKSAALGSEFATRIAVSLALCSIAAGLLALLWKKGSDPLFHAACALVAFGTLGKGPHTLALTGLVYFIYLVATWEWHLLKRRAFITGFLLYLGLAMPWVVVMLLFEGRDGGKKTWFTRFVLYDLFGRLGGVHGERGTFDYYVRYFAWGTLPWSPLIPVALLQAASERLRGAAQRTKEQRFTLVCVIWATAFFAFFTFTSTKFHHYIFPVAVPSALLVGRYLARLVEERRLVPLAIPIVVILGVAALVRDLVVEPHQIADLFSYHYVGYKPSYYFPQDDWWRITIGVFGGLAALLITLGAGLDRIAHVVARRNGYGVSTEGTPTAVPGSSAPRPQASFGSVTAPAIFLRSVVSGFRPTRNAGFVSMLLLAGFFYALFCVHIYQAQVSQHWSHRHLVDTYWSMREPGDRLVSYQMDWKGETFYSHNTDQQIKKGADRLKKAVEAEGRTFILVQQDRYKRIGQALGKSYEPKTRIIDRSNTKWFLVLVED